MNEEEEEAKINKQGKMVIDFVWLLSNPKKSESTNRMKNDD